MRVRFDTYFVDKCSAGMLMFSKEMLNYNPIETHKWPCNCTFFSASNTTFVGLDLFFLPYAL